MTPLYFDDINVYFHMRNHYKMLKKVKSVVNSTPRSKSPKKMSHPVPKKRSKNTLARSTTRKKKQVSSWEGKSEGSLFSDISSSRPSTRRNPSVTPVLPLKLDSLVWEPPPKNVPKHMFKRQTSLPIDVFQCENCEDNVGLIGKNDCGTSRSFVPWISDRSGKGNEITRYISKSDVETKPVFTRSADEHDYLLFLLRVTEDIITNDFYTSKDIKKIFDSHIDANIDRLDETKMRSHLTGLCKELNVSFDEYEREAAAPARFYETFRPLDKNIFENCKNCNALPLTPTFLSNGESEVLQLLDKLSLDRVTERTESCGTVKDYEMFATGCGRFENLAGNCEGEGRTPKQLSLRGFNLDVCDPHPSCEADNFQDRDFKVQHTSESNVNGCDADIQPLFAENPAGEDLPAENDVALVIDDILTKTDSICDVIHQNPEPNLTTITGNGVKVIVDGSIDENDYVLLKGPVYVLKTLLDVEPKLILTKDEDKVESRRDSVDSSKTYTVSCDHVIDDVDGSRQQRVQSTSDVVKTDTELKSEVSSRRSIKSRAEAPDSYSYFLDYDLTPERETGGSDKYHHLLVDAATSMPMATAVRLEDATGDSVSGEIKTEK